MATYVKSNCQNILIVIVSSSVQSAALTWMFLLHRALRMQWLNGFLTGSAQALLQVALPLANDARMHEVTKHANFQKHICNLASYWVCRFVSCDVQPHSVLRILMFPEWTYLHSSSVQSKEMASRNGASATRLGLFSPQPSPVTIWRFLGAQHVRLFTDGWNFQPQQVSAASQEFRLQLIAKQVQCFKRSKSCIRIRLFVTSNTLTRCLPVVLPVRVSHTWKRWGIGHFGIFLILCEILWVYIPHLTFGSAWNWHTAKWQYICR